MPIYDYKAYLGGEDLYDNPFVFKCLYCGSKLAVTEVEDFWPVSNRQVHKVHSLMAKEYKELHGLEDYYLDLQMRSKEIDVAVHYCWNCGWWRLVKNICVCAKEWQVWDIKFGCAGTLLNLDLADISLPLQEVRRFLIANYASRINVNPKLFEELVADIFRGLGYYAYVTGYTNDRGIDIVLKDQRGLTIGVQVKRQKDAIEAEQIRSFVGALFLGEYTNGIYVTTSRYRSGAKDAAMLSANKGILIELIDANRFYDALQISQKSLSDIDFLPFNISKENIPQISFYGWDTPRNAL
jgi:restriction system protein